MVNFSEIRNAWFREQVEVLKGQGITLAEVARRLNVMPQYLTPLLKEAGGRNVSEKMVALFCEAFELNQNDLVKRMRSYEQANQGQMVISEPQTAALHGKKGAPVIPVSALAGFAKGDVSVAARDIIEWCVVPEFERRGVEFYIRVNGDSMHPRYSNGDLLACKRITDLTFFQWGKVYVLDTDQGPLVKRIFQSKTHPVGGLECRSDNDAYPPFSILNSSIRGVAIVLGRICLE